MKVWQIFGVAVAQNPSLPPGFPSPSTPGALPSSTEIPTTEAAKEFDGQRCPTNKWNENIFTPQESSGAYCPQYQCNSCCNDEKLMEHLSGRAEKTTQYGPYHFEDCSSKGNKIEDGTGQMGSKCHEYIKNSHCTKSCDPNSYVFYPDTSGVTQYGAMEIPTCDGFCSDFYEACKNEYICYKNEGMQQVLSDLIIYNNFTEEYNYAAFRCEGAYSCEKLSDTIFAGSGMLYETSGALKDLIDKKLEGMPKREPHEHFCNRFSFKLYQPVSSSDQTCFDPRDASTMVSAVERHENDWNKNNPNNQLNYPSTEPCSTGLSTGAIVGIVIGCLAGVGLIAVAVYFLACKGGSDENDESYTAGQPKTGSTSVEMPPSEAHIVKSPSQRTDYDPNE